jgi:hypothetical protein
MMTGLRDSYKSGAAVYEHAMRCGGEAGGVRTNPTQPSQTQRFRASAVYAGFELKHSFVEAGAWRCPMLISFSNNRNYGATIRRPAPIMMQSYVLVVSASASTAFAVLPSSTYSDATL